MEFVHVSNHKPTRNIPLNIRIRIIQTKCIRPRRENTPARQALLVGTNIPSGVHKYMFIFKHEHTFWDP